MHAKPESTTSVRIDIIRHGEPEGGVRYRGSLDDPLSDTGWQQLQHVIARMQHDGITWNHIVSSPMQRCRAFADHVSQTLNLPLQVEPDLRELSFGDLEGLTPRQAWQHHSELLTRMWQAPESHTAPNGEPFPVFRGRVLGCLQQLIQQHAGADLLIIAHGGVIRAILNGLFDIPAQTTFRMDIPFAAASRFSVYPDDTSLIPQLQWLNRYQG